MSDQLTPRPEKQPRASLAAFALPRTRYNSDATAGSAFDTYILPSSTEPKVPRVRTAAQQARHDAWDKKLAGPGGLMPRRRSLALDEAAAADMRREAGLEEVDEDAPQEDQSDEEKLKKAEAIGSKLPAKFAAKGAGKKGKKQEEIGPSGQTYTPLEKQFKEIKAANPDVLLLMEGGSFRRITLISVGYKYKFLGDDAKVSLCIVISKFILGRLERIGHSSVSHCFTASDLSFPARNFYSASIPVHRLHIHVKK